MAVQALRWHIELIEHPSGRLWPASYALLEGGHRRGTVILLKPLALRRFQALLAGWPREEEEQSDER